MNSFQSLKTVKHDFITGTFISFLLLFFSAHFGYIFYEEYEPFLNTLLSGKLTQTSGDAMTLFALEHVGTTYLYHFLYRSFPTIEWGSLANGFFIIIAGGLAWVIVSGLTKEKSIANTAFKLLFLCLFISSHLIFSNLTRPSFLLCGTSLMLLILVYKYQSDNKIRWKYLLFLSFVFLLGVLTRPEPPVIVLLFLASFAWMMLGWKDLFRVYLFPTLIVGAFLGAAAFDRHGSNEFYKLAEPDLEYQIRVQGNCVPLSEMKTEYDSVRYEAALGGLWSDPEHVSIAFLRSIVNKNLDWHRMQEQLHEFLPIVKQVAMRHLPLVILSTLLAFLFLAISIKHLPIRISILWISFYLLFWALIIMQTYLSKINDRSFASMLSIYFLIQLVFYLVYLREYETSIRQFALTGVLSLFAFIQILWLVKEAHMLYIQRTELQENLALIKKQAEGQVLLMNGSSYISVTCSFVPFKAFDYSAFNRVYMNDIFDLSLIHPYKDFLARECNCDVNDISSFYRFLLKGNKEVYLLSNERRINLVMKYLLKIHQFQCTFEKVSGVQLHPVIQDLNQQSPYQVFLYKLKKD